MELTIETVKSFASSIGDVLKKLNLINRFNESGYYKHLAYVIAKVTYSNIFNENETIIINCPRQEKCERNICMSGYKVEDKVTCLEAIKETKLYIEENKLFCFFFFRKNYSIINKTIDIVEYKLYIEKKYVIELDGIINQLQEKYEKF
jgi:hypothetical protein